MNTFELDINLNNYIKYTGKYYITVRNIENNNIKRFEIDNQITNLALIEIAKPLYAGVPNLEIKYLAIGTSSTPPTASNVQLGTEVFRTADIALSTTGTGVVTSQFTILAADYTGSISEIGIFGGTTATAAVNSGTLISRILWSYTKLATEELFFQKMQLLLLPAMTLCLQLTLLGRKLINPTIP